MLLLLSCLFQYLMALFTGPHSDPADTSHRDDDRCHKIAAPRNGLTTLHTPSWTAASKPAAAVAATPTSRVKVANEILVERMRRLHDVQEKVRGRLTKLQRAIEQWQANCVMNHTSSQPSCCSDHGNSNHDETATRLHSRLEQIVDNYSTTDSSSADELWDGSHGNIRTRRRVLRSNWDRNYAHMRSRWAWLQRQCDLVKCKLPTNSDHVISEDDHVTSHDNDDDVMSSEDHVIQEHCARTEPVRLNRKRPCQLLWQHQMTKKQSTSTRWSLDEASNLWLDQSLWSINNNHSYVTQYSSVAKRQRCLSLQLGRKGYYGNNEDDKHDVESPDIFINYHNDIGHHGNLQETESPMSCYPSMRHITAQNRKKRSAEFDINSFVIPYSIASSVRPEKLEYKEIPTPDWRECPVVGVSQLNGFGVHGEDLSDEAFAKRHAYCEQLEQQRFLHMCAVASNKRRGSTRLLSDNNTPSPSSPVPSPVLRRVPPKPDEDDTMPVVLPWSRRKFPLTEEEEATLVSSISSSPLDTPLDVFSPIESPGNNQWTIVSPLATPLATPPPLASSNHADQKSSIVLRLAKRT